MSRSFIPPLPRPFLCKSKKQKELESTYLGGIALESKVLGVRELGLKQGQDGKGDNISLLDHRVQMSWKQSSGEAEAKHGGSDSSCSINNHFDSYGGASTAPHRVPTLFGRAGVKIQIQYPRVLDIIKQVIRLW